MDDSVRDTILETMEASLEAQLNAVRRLRKAGPVERPPRKKGKSHVDMVYDVLVDSGSALHLKEIVRSVEARFGVKLDPDSLVSALTKCVLKGDRFARPAKNTFSLKESGQDAQ